MDQVRSKQKRIVILGGGLAGLSTHWHLQKAGYDNCLLFEKESRIGGLTRSETVNGFTFDYTGHLLHFKDESIKKLVTELLGDNIHYVARNSWIFSKGVYTRYPFQTNLYGLPPDVIKECILGFVRAASNGHRDGSQSASGSLSQFQTFEQWIVSTLGSGIARHFMLPYNEKLWTVPARELSCEWMGRFVPGTSLEQILEGALSDRSSNIGYNATFGYPLKGGIEALARAFAGPLKKVYTSFEVSGLDLDAKRVNFTNREQMDFDILVSSMPLPTLINLASGVPDSVRNANELLRFTSVYNVNLGVDRVVSDKHWVYFPEPECLFYRVGFSHNFSPYQSPPGCSSIYAEVAYSPWKPLDKKRTVEQVQQDLVRIGILTRQDRIVSQLCLDIPCAYVLYDHRHRENSTVVRNYLQGRDVRTIGRYGSWEYSGMEDAIHQGKMIAEELLAH